MVEIAYDLYKKTSVTFPKHDLPYSLPVNP